MIPKYSFQDHSGRLQARPVSGLFSCFRYVSDGRSNATHYHASYSAVLVTTSRLDAVCCGYALSAEAPLITLCMPFMPHSSYAPEGTEYERYVLYAQPELMERYAPRVLDWERLRDANLLWAKPSPEALERLKLLMRQFELTTDNESAALLLPVLVQQLLSEIDAGRGEIVRMPYPFINSILRELAEKMDAPPTIDEVCRRAGVGRSKLQRDFKAVTGMPWHRYLTMIRMKRAAELLQNGESILHTALACGYSTESHFIMAYRKYYGETPGCSSARRGKQEC